MTTDQSPPTTEAAKIIEDSDVAALAVYTAAIKTYDRAVRDYPGDRERCLIAAEALHTANKTFTNALRRARRNVRVDALADPTS